MLGSWGDGTEGHTGELAVGQDGVPPNQRGKDIAITGEQLPLGMGIIIPNPDMEHLHQQEQLKVEHATQWAKLTVSSAACAMRGSPCSQSPNIASALGANSRSK